MFDVVDGVWTVLDFLSWMHMRASGGLDMSLSQELKP
jgi:hypothetical protein